jgi:hypothetical protein
MGEEKEVSLSLPGEWALKQAFGPVLGELGEDMKKLYARGRDKILIAGYKKIKNKKDGKSANLRVTRDVFWNGSFTDDSICAEYFGGILASSRSDDGKDDSGVFYIDLIKSLSSNQLKAHYLIYTALNQLLIVNSEKANLNPGQSKEVNKETVYLSFVEFNEILENADLGRELHALYSKGLISSFQTSSHKISDEQVLPYIEVNPTPLGIQLYAVAHNELAKWRNYATYNFGEFSEVKKAEYYDQSIENLAKRI